MDDNNRRQNSDYQPNFVMRDSPETPSNNPESVSSSASAETAGQTGGAFRNSGEAFAENESGRGFPENSGYRYSGEGQSYSEPVSGASASETGSSDSGAYGADSYGTGAYREENPGPASWDSESGLKKGWRSGRRNKAKAPSKPVNLTRKGLALIIALCMVVSGVFGIGGAALGSYLFDGDSGSSKEGSVKTTGYTLEDATGSNMTVEEITEAAKPSVVEITTESVASDSWMQQYVTEGAGSGVIITEDGYIITNNHVISGASSIKVTTSDGKEYDAQVIGTDSMNDIAVLKINASGLTPVTYGNSDQLAVGDLAVAIGNPLGELGGTVTAGIISALDRELAIDGQTMNLLQTDTSINPGNSGGGLFNGDGQLIGIVVAKSSGSDVEGLGFAIPVNTAAEVAQQLMENGYVSGQPSTGMSYVEGSGSGGSQLFSGSQGTSVYIYSVDGANAKRAGFRQGDMVYSVDGTEITSFEDLSSIVTAHEVGDTLKFTVLRDGSAMDINLTLEEKTASDSRS